MCSGICKLKLAHIGAQRVASDSLKMFVVLIIVLTEEKYA